MYIWVTLQSEKAAMTFERKDFLTLAARLKGNIWLFCYVPGEEDL